MRKTVCYNDTYAAPEDTRIPLGDRALWFGDGVYEAMIGRNGKAHRMSEHLDRLARSAERIMLQGIPSKKALEEAIGGLLREGEVGDEAFFLYLSLTRHTAERTHAFGKSAGCDLMLSVKPYSLPPADRKMSLISVADRRYEYCDIKTLNLLPSVLAAETAAERGADEAVFVRNGFVTEGSHCNVSMLKNGVLYTHPNGRFILPGTERAHLLDVATRCDIPIREEAFTLAALSEADEIIVTASSKLALAVDTLDEKAVGGRDPERLDLLIGTMRKDYFKATQKDGRHF